MAQRIEELEMAIRDALEGSLDEQGVRRPNGLEALDFAPSLTWRLRGALEQT